MRITTRTMRTIQKREPWLIPITIVHAAVCSVTPFMALFFSAGIIDGLHQRESVGSVIHKVILFSLTLFFAETLGAILKREKELHLKKLSLANNAALIEKVMKTDYKYMEDEKALKLLENIRQCRFQMGDIFEKEINCLERLLTGGMTIGIALLRILTAARNTINMGKGPALLAPGVLLALFGALGAAAFFSARSNISHSKNIFGRFQEIAAMNRIFGFYRKEVFQNYRYGKTVRIFGEKELIETEFDAAKSTIQRFMERAGNEEGRFRVRNIFFQSLLTGLSYLYVGLEVYYGRFTVGDMVQYVGVILQFLNGVNDSVKAAADISGNSRYLAQYFEYLELGEKASAQLPSDKLPEFQEIEFRHVYYRYPNSRVWAVEDVSFKLHKGEHVAIVGKNGSGKTTCIRLLCRLYEPERGAIFLNGVDIREYDYTEYLNVLSVIFQDFKLFSLKLSENVAAEEKGDEKKLRKALSEAGILERAEEMRGGLEAYLYQNFSSEGIEISGGEAQKIAIAKALYKSSDFLVMDEPTAALDPLSEAEIYARLNDILKEKTVVYISHRMSSCIFCDRILVFSEGKIIEKGTHTELLGEGGLYKELWEAQAQYYRKP